mmetsp:Transcript_676/g.1562  ORF Transcript_676/g.1562 Transcript_676/m.1562 type:complete len:225 (-) Transcript_676:319-993(-)
MISWTRLTEMRQSAPPAARSATISRRATAASWSNTATPRARRPTARSTRGNAGSAPPKYWTRPSSSSPLPERIARYASSASPRGRRCTSCAAGRPSATGACSRSRGRRVPTSVPSAGVDPVFRKSRRSRGARSAWRPATPRRSTCSDATTTTASWDCRETRGRRWNCGSAPASSGTRGRITTSRARITRGREWNETRRRPSNIINSPPWEDTRGRGGISAISST